MEKSLRRSCRLKSAPAHYKPTTESLTKKRKLVQKIKREEEPSVQVPDEVKSITKALKVENVSVQKINLKRGVKTEKITVAKSNDLKISSRGKRFRPTNEECEYATLSLAKLHPHVVSRNDDIRKTLLESCGMRDCVTDAIMSTMLSQNTTDANSKAAFQSLKEKFPNWEDVATCEDISQVESAIRVAGLAKTRAERMQAMLRSVKKERGEASLDYIRDIESDEDIKKELIRFKGLGRKTISCVLLFALGRSEFPVDTHVLRISKKMDWISQSETRESAYDHLNAEVPSHLKMDLHCLLVYHGKVCHRCAANGRPQFPPKDGSKIVCPLAYISKWAGSIPLVNDKKVLAEGKEDVIESELAQKKVRIKQEEFVFQKLDELQPLINTNRNVKKECVSDKTKGESSHNTKVISVKLESEV